MLPTCYAALAGMVQHIVQAKKKFAAAAKLKDLAETSNCALRIVQESGVQLAGELGAYLGEVAARGWLGME